MTQTLNHSKPSYQRYINPAPGEYPTERKSRSERIRKIAKKAVATAALIGVAGAGAAALNQADKASKGPKHNAKTEAAIEQVITPEMQKIAKAALKLEQSPTSRVAATQLAEGITEVSGYNNDKVNGSIDVVMRNYPGTNKPNPKDVLVANVQSSAGNDGAKDSAFNIDEVTYIAPDAQQYAKSVTSSSVIFPVDKQGWTAIDYHSQGQGDAMDIYNSNTLDTAKSEYYANGDNLKSVGPVGTAQRTVEVAEILLPDVVNGLK